MAKFQQSPPPPLLFPIQEPQHNPNYTTVFEFEKSFNLYDWRIWFLNNWNYSVYLSIVYVCAIFTIQAVMRDRKRLELKTPLILWNSWQAGFSILATLRTAPELIYILSNHGFQASVCTSNHHNVATGLWTSLFVLSKAWDLVDTIFIVFRKQPLILLHWYHHVTALTYTWSTFSSYNTMGRWFGVMNLVAHSFMYSYYLVKSFKIRVPIYISMMITKIQILQMVLGTFVVGYVVYSKAAGKGCDVNAADLNYSMWMYFTFLVLFVQFFQRVYFVDPKSKAESVKSD